LHSVKGTPELAQLFTIHIQLESEGETNIVD